MSPSSTPSPASRQALWDSWLDAEYNVSLWTMMSERYTRWDDWFKLAVVLASSTTSIAAWTVWTHLPWAWKIISGLGSVAAIVHPQICKMERMQRMSRLVGTWKRIAVSYHSLWLDDSSLKDAASRKQFAKIKMDEVKIDETRLPQPSEKMKRMAARQVLIQRGLPVPEALNGK